MKFVFKEFGTAIRIADIFGGVAARGNLQADSASLEFCINCPDTLAMRVIQSFCNAQNRGEPASQPLI